MWGITARLARKHPREVRFQDPSPVVQGVLMDRHPVTSRVDSGIVHQDLDSAEMPRDPSGHILHLSGV